MTQTFLNTKPVVFGSEQREQILWAPQARRAPPRASQLSDCHSNTEGINCPSGSLQDSESGLARLQAEALLASATTRAPTLGSGWRCETRQEGPLPHGTSGHLLASFVNVSPWCPPHPQHRCSLGGRGMGLESLLGPWGPEELCVNHPILGTLT